jgi:acyl-CoA synthetase (AMP-forming)/AMP-acid ligase II
MNLSEAVRYWATLRGDELAIGGTYSFSYATLNSLVNAKSEEIRQQMKSPRSKVAILEDDNISFVVSLLAIIRTGNIFVLINPTLSPEQIAKSLQSIGCAAYISSTRKEYLPIDYIKQSKCKHSGEVYCPQTGLLEDAGVIFSSGTTGEPKAIMRNGFSILSEVIQWMIELQLTKQSRFLIPRPLYYTGGFVLLYSALFSGGRVDLLDDISTKSVLSHLTKTELEWAFIVPSVVREILVLSSIESKISCNVLTMGAPIYYKDKIKFQERYKCNFIEAWGNSEGLGTITQPSDLFRKPKSVGRPFFTDFLDIQSDGTTNEGVLFGKSDNEFTEYIGNRELTELTLQNGNIISEDLGYKDEDGYFYLTGRTTDIIVVNGIKVFPLDIEKTLVEVDGIADCAVLGISDDIGNETVSAVLVMLGDNISCDRIIETANAKLAPHERICKYITVDSIPKNQGGKNDRPAIKKLFATT